MQNEMAGIGRRLTAVLIDFIMLELAMWPLGLAIRELTPSAASLRLLQFVIAVMYSTVFLGERGQTPGKIMVSLRMLSSDGSAVNPRQALVRSIMKWGCIFIPIIWLASLVTLPTNVQRIGTEAPVELPPLPEIVPVLTFVFFCFYVALIVVTRRGKDRQAPHDRVAGTIILRIT
jgi:uncharacterized RDD family membrane protein YckC